MTAPRSSWQSPYVERVIGSIRRACLNHVIVLNERDLRWILSSYLDYYHRSRTHLSLGKDCPEPRPEKPSGPGKIVAFPQVGGLHHCMNVSRLDPSRGPTRLCLPRSALIAHAGHPRCPDTLSHA